MAQATVSSSENDMFSLQEILDCIDVVQTLVEQHKSLLKDVEDHQVDCKSRLAQGLQGYSEQRNLDPLCSDRQAMMSFYYKMGGIIGLAYFIYQIASWEAHKLSDTSGSGNISTRSWGLIINDWETHYGRRLKYYLSSLHPRLIQTLIDGDLPRRMQESDFRDRIDPLIQMKDTQGCYIVYVANDTVEARSTQEVAAQQSIGNVGLGLTLSQLQNVHDTMALYIKVDDPNSAELAKKVDSAYSGSASRRSSLNYDTERRYGSGGSKDDFVAHDEWLNYIHEHYLKPAEEMLAARDHSIDVDKPLSRCFAYVGLARSVLSRCSSHWHHSDNISALFGLFTATIEHLWPGKFSLQRFTWQIFRTVDRDDIGFDEVLLTALASGHYWDGGLCTSLAGQQLGRGARDQSVEQDARLARNRRAVEGSGISARNRDQTAAQCRKLKRYAYQRQIDMQKHSEIESRLDNNVEQARSLMRAAEDCLVELKALANHRRVMESLDELEAALDAAYRHDQATSK